MKQLDAINIILPFLIKDRDVRAVYVKGSIARGESDEFSDVDLYCLVKEDGLNRFLEKRIDYIREYRSLMYLTEVNFVGPQIVGVYDNGLHFDLYTVTYDTMNRTGEIKILYDPERLLSQYRIEPLGITNDDVVEYFNRIAFSMLEFEAAYCRNDLIWASRLGSHMTGDLSIILRHIYDPDNAQIGLKGLHKKMDKDTYAKLAGAVDHLGPSYLPKGVKVLAEITDEILEDLPKEIHDKVNKRFLYNMTAKINELK
ncbi:nucleotidyltransferase domain-containing protein [Amphibacillus sp. Q70]|uniref:nucleotidyltransferase domain-containing protein n=1 Tax=Amphibacillus sp. Q70 TaxID=3453416 RepID=UPI003F8363F3